MDKPIAVVTGATGFVGSHLVDLLLSKNFEVRCITRKSSNLKWLKDINVRIYDCGLNDESKLRKAFVGANYIFHVAGVVKSKTTAGYFQGNVETTKTLLETALKFKSTIKKFVIVSSLTAVGPSKDEKAVNETSACKPITTYGRSKLAEEEVAKVFMDVLPVTICRAPAVYGERDTEILIYFKTFSKGLTTIVGFDKKLVSLIHVSDFVEGLYLAAISEKSTNEIYFISSEKFYTWKQVGEVTSQVLARNPIKIRIPHLVVFGIAAFAQFFSMFSSKPATLNIEKAKDLTQHAWICDTSKAMRDFGYRQKISIEEGVNRTCKWYLKEDWI